MVLLVYNEKWNSNVAKYCASNRCCEALTQTPKLATPFLPRSFFIGGSQTPPSSTFDPTRHSEMLERCTVFDLLSFQLHWEYDLWPLPVSYLPCRYSSRGTIPTNGPSETRKLLWHLDWILWRRNGKKWAKHKVSGWYGALACTQIFVFLSQSWKLKRGNHEFEDYKICMAGPWLQEQNLRFAEAKQAILPWSCQTYSS